MGENKGKAEGNRGRRGKGVMSYKERYRSTVVEDERIIVYRSRRLLKNDDNTQPTPDVHALSSLIVSPSSSRITRLGLLNSPDPMMYHPSVTQATISTTPHYVYDIPLASS